MRFFSRFKRSHRSEAIDLSQAKERLLSLSSRIDNVKADSLSPDVEEAADELLDLCEQLLRRAVPPDLALLRKCGVDPDAFLSRLDRAADSKVVIAIDSDLDDRIQLQIERLILSKLKDAVRHEYMRACMTKLAAVMIRTGTGISEKRKQARELLGRASRLFAELRDEEGASFVKAQLSSLALQVDGEEVEETNLHDGDEVILRCPCCRENRACKPFPPDTGQLVLVSVRGRTPYRGILFCREGLHFCCGVKARWVRFSGMKETLRRMKATGQAPSNAELFAAKCGHTGCDEDLYVLPKEILDQAKAAGPEVLKAVADGLRSRGHGR